MAARLDSLDEKGSSTRGGNGICKHMKYFVYILINGSKTKTYVGHTNDIQNRLKEHNSGESSFTERFGSWEVLYREVLDSKFDAIKKEKYFKSASGRKWIKKTLFDK